MAARQIKSEFIEKRRCPRIKSMNLVDYVLLDEKGKRKRNSSLRLVVN